MMSDLQQKSALSSAPCSSNGGFDNNISLNSSSNSCFPHSSSSASATYPWGTWEDLLLASAVLRHGMDNWTTVSCELQARAFLVPPSLFSAEACKVRFWILNGRFSSCSSGTIRDGKIPWFEEVRKLRVAQLKRELEHYDGSIGLLEKKLKRLKAENAGSEAVVSRAALEQDNPRFLDPQEAVSCFQVCSAGDRMPAEQSLGTGSLLFSEIGKSSCATASTVIRRMGEVQETMSVSDLKESLTVKNADQNLSSGGLVFDKSLKDTDHNMLPGSILDQSLKNIDNNMHTGNILDPLVCLHLEKINGTSTIEMDHKPHNSQDRPCSIVEDKRSSVKIEDVEQNSYVQDGALSSSMENQIFESEATVIDSQHNCASVLIEDKAVCDSGIKELEDGGLALEDTRRLCSPPGLDRLADDDVTCTVGELGGGVEFSRGSPGLNCLVDDAGCAKSIECVDVLPSSATKLADNVMKENYSVEDSLVTASAMDLLRIAYADGTPVSTPEDVEIQPVESEKTEELEYSEKGDCLCPPLIQGLATCEPDLLCCNVVKVPGQGICGELQRTKQNQTLGIQMTLTKALRGLEEVTPAQIEPLDPVSASGPEHSSEQKGCQVPGMGDVSLSLSNVPIISNSGVETIVETADTGQTQDVGGYFLFPDRNYSFILEPDNKSLNNEEVDTPPANIPQEGSTMRETQDLRKEAGSDSLDCFESFRKECRDNTKVGPCLERDDVKSEERSGVVLAEDFIQKVKSETMSKDVNFPAKMENMADSSCGSGSHMVILGEHPAVSFSDLQEGSQRSTGGIQSVVGVKKESSISAIHCENGTMELAQAVSHGCGPNLVHGSIHISDQILDNFSCHSGGRNFVMEPLFELINKQQEPNPDCAMPDSPLCAGKGTLKASRPIVEKIISEVKADSKTSNKQARLEERSKQMVGCKSSRDMGSSSPLFKGKNKADIDALEEDGLLVDLMKLKDTDLTTLRKRKHLSRGGNNVEKRKDYDISKDGLGEFLVNKHPKISRRQEEDGNKTSLSAAQNKNPSKLKNSKSNSGDNSDQPAISSTVSLLDSCLKFGSKESALEVFSTRRSRLKLRKLDSEREEPDKIKRRNVGSVQKFEAVVFKAADEEASELEISGVLPKVNNSETSAHNGLLPDLLILLECLRSISGHRFAPLFKIRPEIQNDARYRGLVKRHMDLNTVRTKLEEGTYSDSLEFFRDMMLIFSNAIVFYSRDSQEYGAARVLRESLMREMDRFLREESPHRSLVATQAVNYIESKVLKNVNISCSVTICDGKRQVSVKSSCDPTICERGLHSEDGASEATLGTRIAAQDFGLGNSTCVKELDLKKKDQGDLASSKAINKTKMARTKAHGVEDDRLNLERFDKHSRSLEDAVPNMSTKRESVTSRQVLRKSHQASSRTSREYIPRKESSDRSRSSKYSFERPGSSSQGRQEPRESLGGGRSSRSSQQSKQTHSRGIQSYCQPQKRART